MSRSGAISTTACSLAKKAGDPSIAIVRSASISTIAPMECAATMMPSASVRASAFSVCCMPSRAKSALSRSKP